MIDDFKQLLQQGKRGLQRFLASEEKPPEKMLHYKTTNNTREQNHTKSISSI